MYDGRRGDFSTRTERDPELFRKERDQHAGGRLPRRQQLVTAPVVAAVLFGLALWFLLG